MHPNKKLNASMSYSNVLTPKKNPVKYVPSKEEAQIIKAYFLYNNFQDFNTWQQISKSKCEFQFTEFKNQVFQCKAILKWDDPSMPIIIQTAESRNKRSSKKKALYKLVENLIFNGLIPFGFRDTDFIKKLPKRRREVSDSESEEKQKLVDNNQLQKVQKDQFQEALQQINYENFTFLASKALQKCDLSLWRCILRRLQNKSYIDDARQQKLEQIFEEPWQDYCESQFKDTLDEDLTDILRYYQLQLPQKEQHEPSNTYEPISVRSLPSESFLSSLSNNFIQSFHPIEASLFLEHKIKAQKVKKSSNQMGFFMDLQKRIPLPNFQFQDQTTQLPISVVEEIFHIILEFSYKYSIAHQALCILQEEITSISMGPKEETKEAEKYYLRHKPLLTAQFSYLLEKKTTIPAVSLEGMLQWEANSYNFTPKEPEQIVAKKISKRTNINEMEEMEEFTNQEFVLLVSKLNSSQIYIGQLIEAYPTIRIKCHSLLKQNSLEKHPFTIFKLANAKLYNRISKAIIHLSKIHQRVFQEQTVLIQQPPTYPVVNLISQLLSEWIVLRQTVLIVTEHPHQLQLELVEKGFKVIRINTKTEQKHIAKAQIICCSPTAACADTIKNYAFTRVIVEGAHRVSETMCLLPMDKGSEKIYLIGDLKLTESLVFSPFAKKRGMSKSLMARLKQKNNILTFVSEKKQHSFDRSIIYSLSKHFYADIIDPSNAFQSPLVKGFPWPSPIHRIVYINLSYEAGEQSYLNRQAQICCTIVSNVLKSGFIKAKDIGCRVISPNSQAILQMKLSKLYKNHPEYDVKPEDSYRDVAILTGSRLKQRDLNIVLCQNKILDKSYLNGCLQEGRRGVIIIGDLQVLKEDATWRESLREAKKQKLILQADQVA